MAKVYIPQVMDYNVRSAEKFGELTVMLPDNKQMILASGPLTFKLQQELKDFINKIFSHWANHQSSYNCNRKTNNPSL